ncbi:MAG: DUF2752 domain-containing protein [Ferruginibacter sp.]|nr:DUF2752 domain-containing protein [Ferruginibacter sp.]
MKSTFLNIISWLEQRELPCLFKKYFHVDCPGCGFQRSIVALLRGNVSESFLLFPTTFALILFFACFFINNKYEFIKMKNFLNVAVVLLFTFFSISYLYKII